MIKREFDKSTENTWTSINQVDVSPKYQSFINWYYDSNFYNLICHVTSLLKLKHHWKKWYRNQPCNVNFNIFAVKQIEESINVIVYESQKQYYLQELNNISFTEILLKDSKLSLHPLFIYNIIKVEGRNKHANVPSIKGIRLLFIKTSHYLNLSSSISTSQVFIVVESKHLPS